MAQDVVIAVTSQRLIVTEGERLVRAREAG